MKLIILILLFAVAFICNAANLKNAHILQTDPIFSHHIIVVEKSTHRLFLYQNLNGAPKLLKTFQVATGKSRGDKKKQGDRKTPEGIYFAHQFLPEKQLLKRYGNYGKIYGIGAFPLDYPNIYDKLEKKTGNGIWIHSTDDDSRVSKKLDSRGCVVLKKNDLLSLSEYLDINKKTPIIIVDKAYYHDQVTYKTERLSIFNFIKSWQRSWQGQNLYSYISHYDPKKYRDRKRGSFKKFTQYKKAIFSRKTTPVIDFSNHSILVNKDYAVVRLLQNYQSKNLNDVGVKTLYLQKDHIYNWKIVAEEWEKAPTRLQAFKPKQRYFK